MPVTLREFLVERRACHPALDFLDVHGLTEVAPAWDALVALLRNAHTYEQRREVHCWLGWFVANLNITLHEGKSRFVKRDHAEPKLRYSVGA